MDGGDGGRGDGGLAMDDDDYWQLAMAMRCLEPKGGGRRESERAREREMERVRVSGGRTTSHWVYTKFVRCLLVFWSFGLLVLLSVISLFVWRECSSGQKSLGQGNLTTTVHCDGHYYYSGRLCLANTTT